MEITGKTGGRGVPEIVAFAAFAVLAGPVTSVLSNPLYFGLPWQTPISAALAEMLAGSALLGICRLGRVKLPDRRQVLALGALLLPQIASGAVAGLHLHDDAPWGAITIIRFAAPLWLALLWGLQLVPQEIPRATAGAAIAGIGAFCLMTPVFAYRPAPDSVPMLGVHLLLSIATAYSWAFAGPRLGGAYSAGCAAFFLLMQGGCGLATVAFLPASIPSPYGWLAQTVGICVQAMLIAACVWLWFRVLQRMALSAFAMLPLAMWTATALPGVFAGLTQWRFGVAPAIALAAVVAGVGARVEDEQPTALGLREF